MSIGERIRAKRLARGMSLQQLAEQVGVSRSWISQLERDLTTPSLSLLGRIAGSLGVSGGELLDGSNTETGAAEAVTAIVPDVEVVRRSERKGLRLPGSERMWELLTPNLRRSMQLMMVQLDPGDTTVEFYQHHGEEAFLILRGTVRLEVGTSLLDLAEGDCATFDGSRPHRLTNGSNEPAVVVTVSVPPFF